MSNSTKLPKYLARQCLQKFPYILRYKNKWEDIYAIVNDEKSLYEASLKLLQIAYDNNTYYYNSDVPETFDIYFQKKYNISIDEFKTISSDFLKAIKGSFTSTDDVLKYEKQYYDASVNANIMFKSIEKALQSKDGVAALIILSSRANREYEKFNIEWPIA